MDARHLSTVDELIVQLRTGDAHMTFLEAVDRFPAECINVRPPHVDHTFWQPLEHVRFCQIDMLDYLRNPSYRAVVFPDDYWPGASTTASEQQWSDSVHAFTTDLDAVEDFLRQDDVDLWAASAHAWEPAHTRLRTVMVMIDHNARTTVASWRSCARCWGSGLRPDRHVHPQRDPDPEPRRMTFAHRPAPTEGLVWCDSAVLVIEARPSSDVRLRRSCRERAPNARPAARAPTSRGES